MGENSPQSITMAIAETEALAPSGVDDPMIDVLVAGAINTDLVARLIHAPEAGETVTGSTFDIFGGGKGANQTLAAARSGARTAILGAVGKDDFGRQRLADLATDNVDLTGVVSRDDAASGVALITVEESTGQNRIAYVPGATLTITPAEAERAIRKLKPRIFLTTLELPPESIEAAITESRTFGSTVILNATPEPLGARRFLSMIDVLIVNEPEATALLGDTRSQNWWAVAESLRSQGSKVVVITLGEKGLIASIEGQRFELGVPSVTVVDTTGAGDAMCGAFAAALSRNATYQEALRHGAIAGTLACTVSGAQRSMPTLAAIRELL